MPALLGQQTQNCEVPNPCALLAGHSIFLFRFSFSLLSLFFAFLVFGSWQSSGELQENAASMVLNDHKATVTWISFTNSALISSSMDNTIKVWDCKSF